MKIKLIPSELWPLGSVGFHAGFSEYATLSKLYLDYEYAKAKGFDTLYIYGKPAQLKQLAKVLRAARTKTKEV